MLRRRPPLSIALTLAVVASVLALAPGAATAGTAGDQHQVGVVDTTQGRWYLRDAAGATTAFYFGNPGDAPFMGDWDCDGIDTPGLYRRGDGFVYLRNSNDSGIADTEFFFGNPGDVPVPGDFDGDGCDTVSIYRPAEGRFYIINRLGAGQSGLGSADAAFTFGDPGDTPFAGDLDGDGADEVALRRASTGSVYFRTTLDRGPADVVFTFGDPGDAVVAGDWNGDGTDTVGAFRPVQRTFYLSFSNAAGPAGAEISYGAGYMAPVSGNFGALPGGADPPKQSSGPLAPGDRGPLVAELQAVLASKGFYRAEIDGNYGPATSQGVMAFHKSNRLPRTWDWKNSDWDRLAAWTGPDNVPDRPSEADRMEVDIGRQVAYLYQNHALAAVLPISSGNGAIFAGKEGQNLLARTPRGDFKFVRRIDGLRISYLGTLWRPWYFIGGYAIHGSPSVPSYPASHGCIRVTMEDADWMAGELFIGMPFHVWG